MPTRIRKVDGRWRVTICARGQVYRRRFADEDRARAWARQREQELGLGGYALDYGTLADVYAALGALPRGMTLTEAVRIAVGQRDGQAPVACCEAVRIFLIEHEHAGSRSRYRRNLARSLGAIAGLGEQVIGSVTTPQLIALLDGMTRSPASRDVIRRHWHALFSWASRAGMSAGNPAAGIAVVRVRKSRTEIYTPEQAAALLMHARELRDGRMLAYVVLGLFAGIRPEELLRLRWADVRPDYVLVGPDVAKIQGRERHVEVNPTLAAWLSVCRRDLGPVYPHAPMTLRRDRDELVGRSGVTWLQDGMRHSYGSYLYASTHDISRVMANLGHTRPETFSRHYQANVSPTRCEQYWALAPERVMVGRREVRDAG